MTTESSHFLLNLTFASIKKIKNKHYLTEYYLEKCKNTY